MAAAAIIFDFDGVLLDSEHQINGLIARWLTELGHPISTREATEHFTGLSGRQFVEAVEAHIGRALPAAFHDRMRTAGDRALVDGIAEVAGAGEFLRRLPDTISKAVASSSSTRWIRAHLAHLGVAELFGEHIYSGKEHVTRGKPAPDLYLHAADALGADIASTVIVEDSKVGATGALASGGRVIGFAAGRHCLDGHADMLRAIGVERVAGSFDELALMLGLE
jgi:beta-phosphoglucomutase-like phosphatase (HAD superfamily)